METMVSKKFRRVLKEEAKEQVVDTYKTFAPEELSYMERTARRAKRVYNAR